MKRRVNRPLYTREEFAAVINEAGASNGLGAVTTTATIGNLVAKGLPRVTVGKASLYDPLITCAYLMYLRKRRDTGDDDEGGSGVDLKIRKLEEEIRKLELANGEKEGRLIESSQVVAEWSVAGAIWQRRIQQLVDSLRSGSIRMDAAAGAIDSALAELNTAIEKSIAGMQPKSDVECEPAPEEKPKRGRPKKATK